MHRTLTNTWQCFRFLRRQPWHQGDGHSLWHGPSRWNRSTVWRRPQPRETWNASREVRSWRREVSSYRFTFHLGRQLFQSCTLVPCTFVSNRMDPLKGEERLEVLVRREKNSSLTDAHHFMCKATDNEFLHQRNRYIVGWEQKCKMPGTRSRVVIWPIQRSVGKLFPTSCEFVSA